LNERYSRHYSLPDFKIESQEAITAAKVLVVGCGALGHPVMQYLVAAGIGHLGLVDFDKIELSNLQRQVLFTENQVGSFKAESAAKRIAQLNGECAIRYYHEKITTENAERLVGDYDIVVDCTDNFPTRYLLDDVTSALNKILVYGSIYQYEGQVSLFNGNNKIRYRDLYPHPPEAGTVPDCATGGVFGALAGVIGSIMASEVIKFITNIGECLDGRLLIFDMKNSATHIFKIDNTENRKFVVEAKEKKIESKSEEKMIREISAKQLKEKMNSNETFSLIDVREEYEYEAFNIGGKLIPMNEIPARFSEIPRDHDVVIHCKAGARSARVIQYLQQEHGFQNLYNLQNGLFEW
jgi:sulfur-carrier protein adenylyltransferase/sulfurtransferase